MESLFCRTNESLIHILKLDKPFQARIVQEALLKGEDFCDISSLPKTIRERLSEEYPTIFSTKIVNKLEEKDSVKLALELTDGKVIECVRLSDKDGRGTACLSSQVGCGMGCSFCHTGEMGFIRNLTSGEIIEEFVQLLSLGLPITHVVFMGMGEPLLNFNEVMDAVKFLHKEDGLNISYRRITLSTCGIVPGIEKLIEVNIPLRLAVSLVSADNTLRTKIMKVNKTYNLNKLKSALLSFTHHYGKRITLEYCMLSGVNMSKKDAEELKKFSSGIECLINLIEWNPIPSLPYKSPSKDEIKNFTSYLDEYKIKYTLRKSKGRSTSSACGMLSSPK